MAPTEPLCGRGGPIGWPVDVSHRCALPSSLPVRTVRLSGLKTAARTVPACPRTVWLLLPTSQSHAQFASHVTTRYLPSGLIAAARTALGCGKGAPSCPPLAVSQSCTVPPWQPVRAIRPVESKATAFTSDRG